MNRIDIRLPGKGQPELLAGFHGNPQPKSERCSLPPEPICQRPLSEPVHEHWLAPGPVQDEWLGPVHCRRSRDYQFLSMVIATPPGDMRTTTQVAYQELLALIANSEHPQLLRFWNYVPDINAGNGDDEVYRQFCWGRADALEVDVQALPAATGIGSADGQLRISALTASSLVQVKHLENPRQLSAYQYPRQYGPRSPSFARATEVSLDAEMLLLLSGTSSIVHHETRHPHNLCAQIAETHRNIAELVATAPNPKGLTPQHLRCYLRRPEDLDAAQVAYSREFADYPPAAFVQGDICRSELLMEIEGVFRGPL